MRIELEHNGRRQPAAHIHFKFLIIFSFPNHHDASHHKYTTVRPLKICYCLYKELETSAYKKKAFRMEMVKLDNAEISKLSLLVPP